MPRQKPNTIADFWRKVDRGTTPDGCWPWTGWKSPDNYGYFKMSGRRERAHRIAWREANGREIPDGLLVLHSCDNPPCCNPAHLSIGTHDDNMADAIRKGRRIDKYVYAPLGEAHPSHKLTENDVRAIRNIKNMSQSQIGRLFGVSQATVSSIILRKYWPHVA